MVKTRDTRINIMLPNGLYLKAQELIEKGYFSNLSEMVREGLRKQVLDYEKVKQKLNDGKELFQRLNKNN